MTILLSEMTFFPRFPFVFIEEVRHCTVIVLTKCHCETENLRFGKSRTDDGYFYSSVVPKQEAKWPVVAKVFPRLTAPRDFGVRVQS